MPELPEVETVVRDLRPRLTGRRLTTVKQSSRHSLRTRWQPAWNAEVSGQRIDRVERRGKWILIELASDKRRGASRPARGSSLPHVRGGEPTLVVHLGMTGQLTVVPAAAPIADHTHLIFALDGGEQELRFRDIRRFGSVTLFPSRRALEDFFVRSGLGPEPFDLPAKYWRDCLRATKRCLKAVLLDQGVAAGIGNIYADESLFQARLHPARPACVLDTAEADRLRRAIATVLRRAIERRGSSIRNYVGGSGLRGEYQNEFRVYGRTGEPCPRCGTAIACLRLAGRSSHFCPSCQKSATTNHTSNTNKKDKNYRKNRARRL